MALLFISSQAMSSSTQANIPEVGVPFACRQTFVVSQSHQMGTHQRWDTWAWDFDMPQGTPIVAARAGTVRAARGDSRMGGCYPQLSGDANYVVVSHGDLETQYVHLSAVVVKAGDQVREGDLIGYSGSTGFSCGPHLHFKVMRPQGAGWNYPSIQAVLRGNGDPSQGTIVSRECRPAATPGTVAMGGR